MKWFFFLRKTLGRYTQGIHREFKQIEIIVSAHQTKWADRHLGWKIA